MINKINSKNLEKYMKKIAKDIKDLKIQGASNILFSVQDAFLNFFETEEKPSIKKLKEIITFFWETRPTEPAMKKFLTNIYLLYSKTKSNSKIKTFITKEQIKTKESISKIANNFVKYIKNRFRSKIIIITHCHSSIVEKAIIEANKNNLIDFVINTETRPLFQGRITSRNLANAGIKINHIVDSALFPFVKYLKNKTNKNILFLTGADVITNKGYLINKIGTFQNSFLLNSLKINHFVLTISNKIDVVDKNWNLMKVERRKPKEVWNTKNKNIFVWNFSFDVTPAKYIYKVITENEVENSKYLVLQYNSTKQFKKIWYMFDTISRGE